MANDLTLPARKAILSALKADASLIALVPVASIYPQSPTAQPTWPFIRYGAPTAVPLLASCLDGTVLTVAIHGFSKGRTANGALVESAEDHAARIGAAIVAAIGGRAIDVPGIGRLKLRWQSSQLLMDGAEAGAYHVVVNVRGRFFAE